MAVWCCSERQPAYGHDHGGTTNVYGPLQQTTAITAANDNHVVYGYGGTDRLFGGGPTSLSATAVTTGSTTRPGTTC